MKRRLWVVEYYDGWERVWKMPDWVNLDDVVHATRSDARTSQYNLRAHIHGRTRVISYVPERTK